MRTKLLLDRRNQSMLHVKLIYIFTIFAQMYINVVKLITISSYSGRITSFVYLRIGAIIFTDNVKRNLSRHVQTVQLLQPYILGYRRII